MLIRVEGKIDPRVARKKVDPEEGVYCSEVLKTSIISASNNEGQTSKRIPERGRAKKDTKVRGRTREGKKNKCQPCEGRGRKERGEEGQERATSREILEITSVACVLSSFASLNASAPLIIRRSIIIIPGEIMSRLPRRRRVKNRSGFCHKIFRKNSFVNFSVFFRAVIKRETLIVCTFFRIFN